MINHLTKNNIVSIDELMKRAFAKKTAIPAFNIPYLPMMKPVVDALRDTGVMGLIVVARLEWVKFESRSMEAVRDQYEKVKDENYTRLHLDHMPVIDEDNLQVPYLKEIQEAVGLGYESVMIDGSRLSLEDNIAATKRVVDFAHQHKIPVEGELGAVMGHEDGPMPPYEELFASGKGFTDPEEAVRFVKESQVDWLSIACGNIHGAISKAKKGKKKVTARLNIDHIDHIAKKIGIPLVLHGGTGISPEYVRAAIERGIAKINIATAIRQPYEQNISKGPEVAAEAVYNAAVYVLTKELQIGGNAQNLV